MRKPLLALVALALSAAVLPFLGSAAPSPSPLGPGGVYSLHVDLFRAMDACDGGAVAKLFSARSRGLVIDGERWSEKGDDVRVFLQTSAGEPIEAGSAEDARKLLIAQDTLQGSPKGWKTRILEGWMDCPSGEVSYATLHFERTREVDGEVVTRRYRSTSLVSYEDGAWRLWHLHVSPSEG